MNVPGQSQSAGAGGRVRMAWLDLAGRVGRAVGGLQLLALRGRAAGAACALALCLAGGSASAATPVVIGEAHVLHSEVLGEDRGYSVALPPGYATSPDARYPVLYVLDAQDQFAHTATTVEFLAANGEIPPTIVVGVDAGKRVRDYTQTDWPAGWVGGGGAANFQRFLRDELVPAVQRQWRTDGFRTLVGHSASAQFVLHELAVAPDVFRAYVAFSPSLDWDHGLPNRELRAAFDKAGSLPGFAYFAYSDDHGDWLTLDAALADTLQSHAPDGLRTQVRSYPTESHTGMPLVALIDALRTLYPHYRFHPDDYGKGLPAIEAHYAALSKTVGWPLPVPADTLNDYAYSLIGRQDVDAAIAVFQRIVQEHPHSAGAYDSLADGYAEAKRWREAANAGDKALALAHAASASDLAYFERRAAEHHAAEAAGRDNGKAGM